MGKILLVTDNFLPHYGGSRVYYYHLCKNLGFDKISVLTNLTPGWKEFDKVQNFKIYRVDLSESENLRKLRLQQLKPVFLLLKKGFEIIRREDIKVLHCGEPLPTGFVGYLLSKISGIPYLIYIHDEPFGSESRYQPKIKKFLCKSADKIICACSFSKQRLLDEDFNTEHLSVVTPGVDLNMFKPKNDKQILRKHSVSGKKILLTVGRIEEHKGHDYVIKSLPKVLEKIPNLIYMIAGKGGFEIELKYLVKKMKLSKYVKFLGYVRDKELPLYYAASDLFILLNRPIANEEKEGFGMVFLEASACGTPVIGGKRGGTKDSIIDNVTGFRIDPKNVELISKTIIKILSDEKLRKRMAREGIKWANQGFGWKERAEKIWNISRRVTNEKKIMKL